MFLLRDSDKGQEILLQKRHNTGYMDGMWDCSVAGHVENGESMKMALLREAKEEIGINTYTHSRYKLSIRLIIVFYLDDR